MFLQMNCSILINSPKVNQRIDSNHKVCRFAQYLASPLFVFQNYKTSQDPDVLEFKINSLIVDMNIMQT